MPPHGCPGTRDAQRCGGEGTARDGLGSSCRRPELVSPTCGRRAGARGCAQHAWEAAPQDPPLCPRPQPPPPLPAAPPAPHLPPRLPGPCAAQPLAGGTGLGPGRSWLRTEAGGPAPLSSPLGGNPEIPGARLPCGSPARPSLPGTTAACGTDPRAASRPPVAFSRPGPGSLHGRAAWRGLRPGREPGGAAERGKGRRRGPVGPVGRAGTAPSSPGDGVLRRPRRPGGARPQEAGGSAGVRLHPGARGERRGVQRPDGGAEHRGAHGREAGSARPSPGQGQVWRVPLGRAVPNL